MDGIEVELTGDPGTPQPEPTGKAGEPGKPAGKAGKDKDGEDIGAVVRELRSELKATKDQLGELRESERVWFERYERLAKGGRPEPDPDADDDGPEVEDDTADKLVDEFSSKGIEALVKRGVLTKKAAKELIRKEAEKVAREVVGKAETRAVRDSQLFAEFPELRDANSDLYKRTAEVYRQMVKDDPDAADSTRALARAAKEAKLTMRIEQLERGGGRDRDDDRARRVAAQAGDRGRGGGEFRDDDMGPEAREVLRAFERYGATEEDFLRERERVMAGRRAR